MKDLFKSIFNIFKYFGKSLTFIRNVFLNILFIAVLFFIFLAPFSRDEVVIHEDSVLRLTISGNIVEEKKVPDSYSEVFNESIGLADFPEETLLQDILDVIEASAEDQRIESIILDLRSMGNSSLNQLQDIGNALSSFKDTGKKVIVAEDFYSQNKYFLATYASEIFLNPSGIIDIHGFGIFRLYFKEILEKLKINYHVFRIGTYKSALENITRSSMSDEAKSQNKVWLTALWDNYSASISKRRNLQEGTIESYTNNIGALLSQTDGDSAKLALELGLIDGLKSREELRIYLSNLTGNPDDQPQYVSFKQYLKSIKTSFVDTSNKPAVGIIVAQGNILPGEQPPGTIGSDSLIKLIRTARENDNTKAVVLRIDSGGGSVFASEMIRRELQELQNEGKPLVVSMASVAASGGYWIAAEADEIWAHPTTLTGSIGIFGAIPTFENSLAHIGVFSDGIGTTKLSSGINPAFPIEQELKDAIQLSIRHGYMKFLEIVKNGRDISDEKLAEIAEGRVFDGANAQDLGLVDQLGTLDDAVSSAAKRAGLADFTSYYISSNVTFQDQLFRFLNRNVKSFLIQSLIPKVLLEQFKRVSDQLSPQLIFNDPGNIYAHWLMSYQ